MPFSFRAPKARGVPIGAVLFIAMIAPFAFSAANAASGAGASETGALVLKGVSGRGTSGAAFISDADGRQRRVPVGGMVADGLWLKSIGAAHVMLSDRGGGTAIRLDLSSRGGAVRSSRPASAPRAGRSAIASAKTRMLASFEQIEEKGRIVGFRAGALLREGALGRAGLREGDILLAVNGSPALTQERLTEFATDLALGEPARISYRRGRAHHTAVVKP